MSGSMVLNCALAVIVVNVLKSGMLVQGKKVEELESTTKELLKTENVVATSNGTSTMHLALVALGVGVGDKLSYRHFPTLQPLML